MLMPLSIFANAKGARRNVWDDPLRNVDFEWVKTAESPALARRLASILIAGPVAERVFGPRLPRATASVERLRDAKALLAATSRGPTRGSRGLAGRSRGLARGSGGASVDSRELFEKVLADSERFLKEPRVKQAVAALAAILLERGTIRGGEAASIIETFLDE
jgi:hypothetical protein